MPKSNRRYLRMGLMFGSALLFSITAAFAAEAAAEPASIKPIPLAQIFTFLFLMLGPIKIIGTFAKITKGADSAIMRQMAFRATLYSCLGLLFAILVGESILKKWGVPLPILTVAGGIILFLVALQTVLQQYKPSVPGNETVSAPSPGMAVTPLAFPTIVTPYGIAAVIIFIAISPDMSGKLAVGGALLGVMAINLLVMLVSHHILRWGGVLLQILGSVLGILQVALGLDIIVDSFRTLMMG